MYRMSKRRNKKRNKVQKNVKLAIHEINISRHMTDKKRKSEFAKLRNCSVDYNV